MFYFGALRPLLRISGNISSRVQNQGDLSYSLCGGKCNEHSLRPTSGATPTDLIDGQMATNPVPSILLHVSDFKCLCQTLAE